MGERPLYARLPQGGFGVLKTSDRQRSTSSNF